MDTIKIKRVGTREEVFKGNASRTAGGLKKEDIIEKQFGTRTIYISRKLSDKMRENFNIIRLNNPNHFKRMQKKTMVASNQQQVLEQKRKQHSKTQKLSFKIMENTVKNVFYPELQGMNIQDLKEELAKEEAEEDLGRPKADFTIQEMPDIDISNLE